MDGKCRGTISGKGGIYEIPDQTDCTAQTVEKRAQFLSHAAIQEANLQCNEGLSEIFERLRIGQPRRFEVWIARLSANSGCIPARRLQRSARRAIDGTNTQADSHCQIQPLRWQRTVELVRAVAGSSKPSSQFYRYSEGRVDQQESEVVTPIGCKQRI